VAHRLRKVLVVDDNEDVRRLIVRFVELMGHDVAAAADGLTALSIASIFQPDCAILDLSLHDITGSTWHVGFARHRRPRDRT
jgi:CheY-like chemotaxis protein